MKAALISMDVVPGKPAKNLRRAEELMHLAVAWGPDLVCLPEMIDVSDIYPHGQFRYMAEPIPGRYSDQFAAWARSLGIYVVVGLMERCEKGFYSSAILLDPAGDILMKHRQVHNGGPFLAGDSFSSVATPVGRISLAICGDVWEKRFHEHCRTERPDWVFVPMDWCGEDDEIGLVTDDRPPRYLRGWKMHFRRGSLQSGANLYAANAWSPDSESGCGSCGGAFMFSRGREVRAPGVRNGRWRQPRSELIYVFE